MGRSAAVAIALGLTLGSGCLELDPSFVEEETGGSGGVGDGDGEGTAAGTAAGTADETADAGSTAQAPADCSPDAFEPSSYEDPADLSGMPMVSARLESDDAEDWYKAPLDPGVPIEVFARATGGEVRVCFFVECDGGAAAQITKCAGEPAVDPNWVAGCCAPQTVGLEYDCGGTTQIIAHVRVDEGADCPAYELEIGISDGG